MELTIDKRKKEINIINNFRLSYWDMLYWQNFKVHCNDLTKLKDKLRNNAYINLEKLYAFADDEKFFEINPNCNDSLDSYYNGMVENAKKDGAMNRFVELIENEYSNKKDLAKKFSKQHYEGYRHLVNIIKGSNYSDSFKCLILKESISKIYKVQKDNKLKVCNRKICKNIDGIINLPLEVLDYIYNNVVLYKDFGTLYLDAQSRYKQDILLSTGTGINLTLNTSNKGQWIKFDGKNTDSKHYTANVSKLGALVANTNWCTSSLANEHLSEGDFYVFVDNLGEPRIAVKMTGDRIDEVRGRANGNGQELEDEYRDVVIEFLENNKEIKNAENWLQKEVRNKQLLQYIYDIDNDTFSGDEVGHLFATLVKEDYKKHGQKNMNVVKLAEKLPKIKKDIAKFYGYKEDQVWVGEWKVGLTDVSDDVKMVIGDVSFPYLVSKQLMTQNDRVAYAKFKHKQFLNVERVVGNVDFFSAEIEQLYNLKEVYGNLIMSLSKIKHLGVLTDVYGNLELCSTNIESLGELKYVGNLLDLTNTKLLSTGKLKKIGGNLVAIKAELVDTGEIEEIGGGLNLSVSKIKKLLKVKRIGGTLNAIYCELEDLGVLESVGGDLITRCTKLTGLSNVREVGGDLCVDKNVVTLGKLTKVGKCLDVSKSSITELTNIDVGKDVVVDESKYVDVKDLDIERVVLCGGKEFAKKVISKEDYLYMNKQNIMQTV